MLTKLRYALLRRRRFIETQLSMQQVSGPNRFNLEDDEAVGVCVGQNTEFYLPFFFEWHQNLGIRKFIYFDNDSTDNSIDVARRYSNVIVVSCTAPFRTHQEYIRYYSITKFVRGGWRLVIDSDELFDYPGSDHVPLQDLLQWLNASGKTGVVAHMLDMIPDGGLKNIDNRSYTSAIASCSLYDISAVERKEYYDKSLWFSYFLEQNTINADDIKFYFNGIRKILFNENCCLSKHPLFRIPDNFRQPPHPHAVPGLVCADFTALLRHYKFTGQFVERERDRLTRRAIAHNETRMRIEALDQNPDMIFRQPTSKPYSSPEGLLDDGFLFASNTARAQLQLPPQTASQQPQCFGCEPHP